MTRLYAYLTAAVLSFYATLPEAAPIVVRSGAHDGFSRLVLDVPSDTNWFLETEEGRARVTIRGHTGGFNTEKVYKRIDQSHIAQLDGSNGTLEIEFSCKCVVSAFSQSDKMVVLDVSNAPSNAPSPIPLAERQRTQTPTLRAFQFGNRIASPSTVRASGLPNQWYNSLVISSLPAAGKPEFNTAEDSNAAANSLARAQREISEHVGSAATRGVLTPKTSSINLPLIPTNPQIDVQIFDASAHNPVPEQVDSPTAGNINITSSSDIPTESQFSTIATTLGVRCIDPQVIAIEDWASDRPFSAQISKLRNILFSEIDRLNEPEAVQLAQAYLHFGFGSEARQVLGLDPGLARDNPALLEMAEIMEFGYVKQPSFLHHFTECDTNVALWATLSDRAIEPSRNINISAALRAVTALPMHLRVFIAPELSRRFLNYGDADAAAAALRSLERTAHPLSSGATLAKADIEMAQGNTSAAQDRLAHVVASNVEQSAEALIKFVDSHLKTNTPIEHNVATLIESYALQMRDEPIGGELQRAHILALGKSGQFQTAFETLDRARSRSQNDADGTVASILLELLARSGSDIEFLDHVFQQDPKTLEQTDPMVVLSIAERLEQLGFPADAERLLTKRADIPSDGNAKVIQARIALSLSRPFEAEALLFGLETTEADTLRAKAKVKTGAFDEAHELFSQLGEESESRETAWLSDDWISLVGSERPILGPVARVAQTQISDDPNPNGMLLRTSEAISESAEARSIIEDLLSMSTLEGASEP